MNEYELTRIGNELAHGKPLVEKDLRLLLETMRKFAQLRVSAEQPGQTFQSTALMNEAYLRLCGSGKQFRNSQHFFGVVADAMRSILVDNARRKKVRKRHVENREIDMGDKCPSDHDSRLDDILDLDEALSKLAAHDAELAEIVKLRRFAGLSVEETAAALQIPERSAFRKWRRARAWLFSYLTR